MSSSSSELILEQSSKSFDGYQYVYSHDSYTVGCKMKFGVYVPSIADEECVPLLIFLSGLNCTEQNFITKSGVQRLASKYGFIVANPDTTPRDCEIECAGYYIDAKENYQMFSYINDEFYELIIENFNVDINRIGIFGHNTGGHGALISFFKCPTQYKSISAFAPIYKMGQNEEFSNEYNACELVGSYQGPMPYAPILIDQNCDNKNDLFLNACTNASFPIQFREQIGYDNNYFFLQTFLEDHFKYHKKEFEYLD